VQAGDRRDVDDASPLARQHVPPRRLREQERAGEVDVDHLLPFVERQILGLGGPRHARVVDQDVDLPVNRDCLVDHRLHVRRFRDVARHAFHAKAARAHRVDGRLQPFVAPRAQHQRAARFAEAFGHLLSEPARSAGDDRDTPRERE